MQAAKLAHFKLAIHTMASPQAARRNCLLGFLLLSVGLCFHWILRFIIASPFSLVSSVYDHSGGYSSFSSSSSSRRICLLGVFEDELVARQTLAALGPGASLVVAVARGKGLSTQTLEAAARASGLPDSSVEVMNLRQDAGGSSAAPALGAALLRAQSLEQTAAAGNDRRRNPREAGGGARKRGRTRRCDYYLFIAPAGKAGRTQLTPTALGRREYGADALPVAMLTAMVSKHRPAVVTFPAHQQLVAGGGGGGGGGAGAGTGAGTGAGAGAGAGVSGSDDVDQQRRVAEQSLLEQFGVTVDPTGTGDILSGPLVMPATAVDASAVMLHRDAVDFFWPLSLGVHPAGRRASRRPYAMDLASEWFGLFAPFLFRDRAVRFNGLRCLQVESAQAAALAASTATAAANVAAALAAATKASAGSLSLQDQWHQQREVGHAVEAGRRARLAFRRWLSKGLRCDHGLFGATLTANSITWWRQQQSLLPPTTAAAAAAAAARPVIGGNDPDGRQDDVDDDDDDTLELCRDKQALIGRLGAFFDIAHPAIRSHPLLASTAARAADAANAGHREHGTGPFRPVPWAVAEARRRAANLTICRTSWTANAGQRGRSADGGNQGGNDDNAYDDDDGNQQDDGVAGEFLFDEEDAELGGNGEDGENAAEANDDGGDFAAYDGGDTAQTEMGKGQNSVNSTASAAKSSSSVGGASAGPLIIPNVVHLIYGFNLNDKDDRSKLHFYHFLNVLSIQVFMRPDRIYLHHHRLPTGFWFELMRPLLTLIKARQVDQIFGRPIEHYAHQSDIVRLEVLMRMGGIYFDFDVIVLKSFDPLRRFPFVLGKQEDFNGSPRGLCNAVIMSRPNAVFVRTWYEHYRTFDQNDWDGHSVRLPLKLARRFTHGEVTILEPEAFFKPAFFDLRTFYERADYDFSRNYASHLWSSSLTFSDLAFRLEHLTPANLGGLNSTYARMAKRVVGAAGGAATLEQIAWLERQWQASGRMVTPTITRKTYALMNRIVNMPPPRE